MRGSKERRWCARILGMLLLFSLCLPYVIGRGGSASVGLFPNGEGGENIACGLPYLGEAVTDTAGGIGVSAASAVVIEASTGQVLYAKDADVRRPMASTTKIMTALIAIEDCDLTMTVKIPKEAVGVEGSSIYLVENERLTMGDLVYALMLESANDAATAIAVTISGSVEAFARRMNEKADELGLQNTSFENPHGLDGEAHYTTAYDLAYLTAYALQNETFCEIVSTLKKTIPLNGTDGVRLLINHNRLLRSYEGCIGVKTGYTKRCGRCLVSAAERDGVTLVAVTLNAPDDWNDHRRMLDDGFSRIERVSLLPDGLEGFVPTVGGTVDSLHYAVTEGTEVILPKDEHEIRYVTELSSFYYAPIAEGEVIGRVVCYDGDTEIASLPITAQHEVLSRKERRSFFTWLRSLFS